MFLFLLLHSLALVLVPPLALITPLVPPCAQSFIDDESDELCEASAKLCPSLRQSFIQTGSKARAHPVLADRPVPVKLPKALSPEVTSQGFFDQGRSAEIDREK